MIAIILIECLGLSYILTCKWHDGKACKTVVFSNLVSGIFGIVASIILNGGWWLVVWFPWVSEHEVNGWEGLKWLTFFYVMAFIFTLIIEGIVNYSMLKKNHKKTQILMATFIVNVISYGLGSIAMYSYSF